MRRDEADRFNIRTSPTSLMELLRLLRCHARSFLTRYKVDLTPATDNRSYVTHSLKGRTVPELLRLRSEAALHCETGYIPLWQPLSVLIAAAVLILLPLVVLRRQSGNWRMFLTFAAIGLAFLFVGVFFIQKLTLLLGRPLWRSQQRWPVSDLAGVGSGLSRRVRSLLIPTAGIARCSFSRRWSCRAGWGQGARAVAASLTLIVPLAIFMGMPFRWRWLLLVLRTPTGWLGDGHKWLFLSA